MITGLFIILVAAVVIAAAAYYELGPGGERLYRDAKSKFMAAFKEAYPQLGEMRANEAWRQSKAHRLLSTDCGSLWYLLTRPDVWAGVDRDALGDALWEHGANR